MSPLNHEHKTQKEASEPSFNDEKEIVSPINDTDKEVLSRSQDMSKEVLMSNHANGAGQAAHNNEKILNYPPQPSGMDKELASSSDVAAQTVPVDTRIPFSSSEQPNFPLKMGSGHNLLTGFRLEKKHALGLIAYQNQQIACRTVDLSNHGTIGPAAFVTSSMKFWEISTGQAPLFDLYTPPSVGDGQAPQGQLQVARWVPGGLEGLVRMRGQIECIVPGQAGKSEMWQVKRRGILVKGREYAIWKGEKGQSEGDEVLAWKGSTRAIREVLGEDNGKQLDVKHGGLKLVDAKGEILALWNQWRDEGVLGDLFVFQSVRDKISVEAVVASAIVVVTAERVTGVNWVGGIGK